VNGRLLKGDWYLDERNTSAIGLIVELDVTHVVLKVDGK
jgi:hypothetical protein